MGLKEKSSVVSILIGVLLAAVAIAQITYVILSGNENIRIFLVGSAMGIFVVLGLTVLRVVQNDNDVEDVHKERATAKAKECPDYWAREWRCGEKTFQCKPQFSLPDGTEMRMSQANEFTLAEYNTETAANRCDDVLSAEASHPYTDLVNRCNARARKS